MLMLVSSISAYVRKFMIYLHIYTSWPWFIYYIYIIFIYRNSCIIYCLQQEDEIMEATEGIAEASSISSHSVQAFAQLAKSDRVSCIEFYIFIGCTELYSDIFSCVQKRPKTFPIWFRSVSIPFSNTVHLALAFSAVSFSFCCIPSGCVRQCSCLKYMYPLHLT